MQNVHEKKELVAEFEIQDLIPIGVVFVATGLVLAFGANILVSIQASFTVNSMAYNITQYALTALNTLTSNLGNIALVMVGAILIGLLLRYFAGAAQSR